MPKVVVVFLVVCGLFTGFAFASPVDEIIRLCKAEMAEDIVVTAAKKQPSSATLTTDQMLAVKSACKSDAVLRALMSKPVPVVVTQTEPAGAGEEAKPSRIASATSSAKSAFGVATSVFKKKGGSDKDEEIERVGGQRLFITAKSAEIGGEEFADKSLTESVGDLKSAAKKFSIVETEGEADLKLVVLGRQYEQVRATIMRHKTPRTEGILNCALYRREGEEWKPVVKLRSQSLYWKDAASKMISEVDKALR